MLEVLPHAQRSLFWSSPSDFAGDFVIEDPLAFDYLSQQVGNWLFGGLTTRTSRAQYFAIVLYGLQLVDEVIQTRALGAEDEERKRLFERWERLWALAVHEYRGGQFERSDEDAIRGQRGVARTWRAGNDGLPLDYKLIGRQSELGSLGAYMTSLRHDDLVFAGSMRPTALAMPIIDAFWAEEGSGAKVTAYQQFAELAMDLDEKKAPRKLGAVTLSKLGELTRLSVLTHGKRTAQQARLWIALFERAKDDTLRFAEIVRLATKAGIRDPRAILEAALGGSFGVLEQRHQDKLTVALAFGDVQQALLTCFNRAYASALANGWRVDVAKAAAHAFGGSAGDTMHLACARLLDTSLAAKFRTLPMHGGDFLKVVTTLRDANPTTSLEALVLFHAAIHHQRRRALAWLRIDSGRLVIDVGAYGARSQAEGTFPGLKISVVRNLLADLGRLS